MQSDLDTLDAALSSQGAAPRARTGRPMRLEADVKDGRITIRSSDGYKAHIALPTRPIADEIAYRINAFEVEAGALPAPQGAVTGGGFANDGRELSPEEKKSLEAGLSDFAEGRTVVVKPGEDLLKKLDAQGEGKGEGPVASLPDASRQEDGK
jgi:hypothetical protein